MHIWVICQYYKPESGAPTARLSGFAELWQKLGQKVTVFTGIPNHPTGVVPEEYRDKPKYFEEEVDGVTVRRHWLFITKHEGKFKRAFNQLSFAFSVLFKNWRKEPDTSKHPDIIVASSPSFFCVISGLLLARKYKVPFVFEVRDLWPDIFVDMGILREGLLLNMLEWLELRLYKWSDAVVTVSRGYAKDIASRGIDHKKLFVITNGVNDESFDQALQPYENGRAERLRNELNINPLTKVVLYIGNHGQAQALGQLIDAARQLIHKSDVQFLMVGDGADKERLVTLAKGIPNIRFIENQPREKVWEFYAMSDLSIVCLRDIPGFKKTIPSKMFEIMASRTPIVGAVAGEAANILKESGAAAVVPPEDSAKMAQAIGALLDNPRRMEEMAAAGRVYVSQNYKHSDLGKRYLGIFKHVMEHKQKPKKK